MSVTPSPFRKFTARWTRRVQVQAVPLCRAPTSSGLATACVQLTCMFMNIRRTVDVLICRSVRVSS